MTPRSLAKMFLPPKGLGFRLVRCEGSEVDWVHGMARDWLISDHLIFVVVAAAVVGGGRHLTFTSSFYTSGGF